MKLHPPNLGKQTPKNFSLTPLNDLELLREFQIQGTPNYILGIDEVGVACLAGPVVAGCFAYPACSEIFSSELPCRVWDSKKLSENQKQETQKFLTGLENHGVFWGLGQASPEEIDDLNIYHATSLAMVRAFEKVWDRVKNFSVVLIVDGNRVPMELVSGRQVNLLGNSKFNLDPKNFFSSYLVKGDLKSFAVAAASIIAKVHRDSLMFDLGRDFPDFGWETNVGYPTETHRRALTLKGPTIHHRKSFRLDYSETP